MENSADRVKIILDSAKNLFWKHGFRRVTVEEICKKAGISKMTFYRYFENKIDLAKSVFLNVVNKGYEDFVLIMKEETSSEEKIKKILLLKHEGTNDISEEFLADFYSDKNEELKVFVNNVTDNIWQSIINDFKSAQQKGLFRKDLNVEFFFLISEKLIELFNDQQVLKLFSNPQEMIMESTRLLLYGITPIKA